MTNRPTYAPERRPGDASDDLRGRDLLVVALDVDDALTVAAFIEAGAAALELAPGSATDVVEQVFRRHRVQVGREVAAAVYAERDRVVEKRRYLADPKGWERRRRKALRDAEKPGK